MDFDGDGRLDLLSGSNCCDSTAFHLFRRMEDGSWAPRRRLEMTPPGKVAGIVQSFVTAADWNGDGVPDLLIRSAWGSGICVALGPLQEKEQIAITDDIDITPRPIRGEGGTVRSFEVADWNRDGKPDLLASVYLPGRKHGIFWYQNLGGPGLTKLAEGKLLVEFTSDMNVMGFCGCDWNGDGWLDLLLTRADEPIHDDKGKHVNWRSTVWLYLRE